MTTSAQSYRWILASGSPRRKELLAPLPVTFEIIRPDIHEEQRTGESPVAYAQRNASEKSHAVLASLAPVSAPTVLISADTFVVLGEQVLEKPADKDHAEMMLRQLSGQTHQVVTAFHIVVADPDGSLSERGEYDITEVTFKSLTDEEIGYYTSTPEPYDKAGGYALQGLGAFLVERVNGSYSTVIGLPVHLVFDCLRQHFAIMLWR